MTDSGDGKNSTSELKVPVFRLSEPAQATPTERPTFRCYYVDSMRALGHFVIEAGLPDGLANYRGFRCSTNSGDSILNVHPTSNGVMLRLYDYTGDSTNNLITQVLRCFSSEADTLNLIEITNSLAESRKRWYDYFCQAQRYQVVYSPGHERTYHPSTDTETLQANFRGLFDRLNSKPEAEDRI